MIFAVAAPQLQACAGGSRYAPTSFDTGAVVVNPFRADIKGLDCRDHQAGEQGGALGLVELIQSASKPIIVQAFCRPWVVIESSEVQGIDPLSQFIERILGQGQIDDEQNQQ